MRALGIPDVHLTPTVPAVPLGEPGSRILGRDLGTARGTRGRRLHWIEGLSALPAVHQLRSILGPTADAQSYRPWGRKLLRARVAELGTLRILLPAIPTDNHFRPHP